MATDVALTQRETQIVKLLASGSPTADIAKKLEISESTVLNHRRYIRLKIGAANLADLTRWAIRQGLVKA